VKNRTKFYFKFIHKFKISPSLGITNVSQSMLDSMNVEQCMKENKQNLEKYGGVEGLAVMLGVSIETGLTLEQVQDMRTKFGPNVFPETPMKGFFVLFMEGINKYCLFYE